MKKADNTPGWQRWEAELLCAISARVNWYKVSGSQFGI